MLNQIEKLSVFSMLFLQKELKDPGGLEKYYLKFKEKPIYEKIFEG